MSRLGRDDNLLRTMAQPRIKSSFIYLANAVNDLRGNWAYLAVTLAPLIILASLCLLPEALNLQHRLAASIGAGGTRIGYFFAQEPFHPAASASPTPYPDWLIYALRGAAALISQIAGLVVLVDLRRIRRGEHATGLIGEMIEVYAKSARIVLAYLWIAILQLLAPAAAVIVLEVRVGSDFPALSLAISIIRIALLIAAGVVYLWLYFADYALVFDDQHSFHALLFSRDLMRKRFFTVASRIVVFLAVWSGYNSWAVVAAFVIASLLVGPVAQVSGVVWSIVILLNLMWLSVGLATTAFFIAAGVRMYQDLTSIAHSAAPLIDAKPESPTIALTGASA